MFKVLVWDYVSISSQWLEQATDKKDIEVVGTITPFTPTQEAFEILSKKDAWCWLLIFEQGTRNFFEEVIQVMKLPLNRVIYALDINSWAQHPKATYTLLDDMGGGIIRRQVLLNEIKKSNAFITCTVEGLSYVATSDDNIIMKKMYVQRVNWAENNIKRFYKLTAEAYNVDDSAGYFLDLGANIGTTGLYFIKKLAPNLKLLAFEPDPENFKLLLVNIILNDMRNKAMAVNCGLGNTFDEMTMYRNLVNPGGNSVFQRKKDMPTETIKIIPLDSYLAEKKIAAQEVKYIWIDTEGFEAQVLLGAQNLLRENPAPIFMECNLRAWDNSGCFDDMINLLAEGYSHFVHFYNGEKLYPLDALRTMERPNNPLGQIGDIFLIRRGAIA